MAECPQFRKWKHDFKIFDFVDSPPPPFFETNDNDDVFLFFEK